MTKVTAIVADSNGTLYVNAPFTVSFYDPGTSGELPLLNNSTFQTDYTGYSTDSSGRLSIDLPDNNVIAATSGATGTQWIFSILTAEGTYTTRYAIPNVAVAVSGTTQDISAILTAVAPLLPRPASVNLQTNGIANSIQSILNLKNGSNVTLTPDGSGGVTIDSTGGGGGGGTTPPAGNPTTLQYNNNGAFGGAAGLTTNGNNLTIKGPSPWIDAAAYGVKARSSFQVTTATTAAGSPSVGLGGMIDFINGDGIVIWKAGSATTQSTPGAPTVTSPAVQGSRTINYKCVGVDKLGGLTAASSAGTVTNAPTVMGDQPIQITSLTQTAGVVSVVLSAPMPRLTAGMQIAIINEAGTHTVDGVYPVATSSDTSHFTYNLAGNAGSIAIGAYGAWARLANTFNITSITRSGTTMTITTNVNHGFQVQSGGYTYYSRTIAVIQGVDQSPEGPTNDMNGQYVILTASGNTMTVDTGISGTETGTLLGFNPLFQPTVTVYEYITVICPQITVGSQTVAYYIYADYNNAGNYILIGKTLPGYPGQSIFTDYGPWQGGAYTTLYVSPTGYVAPGYVPTTPPVSAQNQMYIGTIVSGAGTPNIIVTPSVPSLTIGQVAMHDEGINLMAALTAANAIGGATVYLPPSSGKYIFNSPMDFTAWSTATDIRIGSPLIINETIKTNGYTSLSKGIGQSQMLALSFDRHAQMPISGLASPMISSVVGPLSLADLYFGGSSSASQTAVYASGSGVYGLDIDRCVFVNGGAFPAGTSVPLVLGGSLGITSEVSISDSEFAGYFNGMGNGFTSGGSTINLGPNIPLVWLRGNDDQSSMPQVTFSGQNVFAGRGVLYDGTYGQFIGGQILNYYEYQSPLTPTAMYYGTANFDQSTGLISSGNNDSQPGAIAANWSPAGVVEMLTIDKAETSGLQGIVTGSAIYALTIRNMSTAHPIGQNFNLQSSIVQRSSGKWTVLSGDLKALPGTVFSLIPSPGTVSRVINIISVTFQYRYGTTVYTIGNSDNTLSLVYHGHTTPLASATATGFVDQGANQIKSVSGSYSGSQANSINLGVDLTILGTTPALTLGDGTLEIVIDYSIVDVG